MRGTAAAASWIALAGALAVPTVASAHIGVTSPVYAGTTQELTFNVGHGCEGADTLSISVEIPASVTSIRVLPSDFGTATVDKDPATELVKSVTWVKDEADLRAADDAYYKLSIRAKIPAQPFTTLFFKTKQTCKVPGGATTVVDWVGEVQSEAEGGLEPAPAALVLPPRKPGWNKFKVPAAIADLAVSKLFDDAQVVWKGTAAFSSNPVTADQIKATAGVTALTALSAGDEIWVKY